jgi:phospholipid/cholesterol/gamma-HCH transport system permease protein
MTLFEFVGRWALTYVEEMGRMLIFVMASFAWLVRPPFRGMQIIKQLHFIGYKSTFVVVLTAAFTGMVLALHG